MATMRRDMGRGPRRLAARFLADESGATAIEYGLICSLIFLVISSSIALTAGNITAMWNRVSTAFNASM